MEAIDGIVSTLEKQAVINSGVIGVFRALLFLLVFLFFIQLLTLLKLYNVPLPSFISKLKPRIQKIVISLFVIVAVAVIEVLVTRVFDFIFPHFLKA